MTYLVLLYSRCVALKTSQCSCCKSMEELYEEYTRNCLWESQCGTQPAHTDRRTLSFTTVNRLCVRAVAPNLSWGGELNIWCHKLLLLVLYLKSWTFCCLWCGVLLPLMWCITFIVISSVGAIMNIDALLTVDRSWWETRNVLYFAWPKKKFSTCTCSSQSLGHPEWALRESVVTLYLTVQILIHHNQLTHSYTMRNKIDRTQHINSTCSYLFHCSTSLHKWHDKAHQYHRW